MYLSIYIYTHQLRNLPSLLETALFPVAPFEGGGCDGILLEGDLVLSVNGKPVTKPHVTWIEKMENMHLTTENWKNLRLAGSITFFCGRNC